MQASLLQVRNFSLPWAVAAVVVVTSAAYMAKSGKFDHDADGRQPAQRIAAKGYRYCMVAENIAYEFSSRGFASSELAQLA